MKLTNGQGKKDDKKELPCLYGLLRNYVKMRKPYLNDDEQFFVFADRSPVSADHVRKCLRKALKAANFNNKLYSFHCLHSGRAGDLLKLGLSVETIKKLGRWRSNAVFKYLRN